MAQAVVTDAREFVRLVEELADLEQERTGSGGLSGMRAARRAQVERRLMELLGTDIPEADRRVAARVGTNLTVRVKLGDSASPGRVADVGVGGAYIETQLGAELGAPVEVEIERLKGSLAHGFHLRGQVAWQASPVGRKRGGIGIAFAARTEADERRLRRFVLDVLREHMPHTHD